MPLPPMRSILEVDSVLPTQLRYRADRARVQAGCA
jgi:hypothetical protein